MKRSDRVPARVRRLVVVAAVAAVTAPAAAVWFSAPAGALAVSGVSGGVPAVSGVSGGVPVVSSVSGGVPAPTAPVSTPLTGGTPTATGSPLPSGVDACPSPVITGVATATGQHFASPGTTVYVAGSGFTGMLCTDSVSIGGTSVAATSDSGTKLQFAMPSGTPGGAVRVTVSDALGDTASSNANYNVVTLPVVDGLSPTRPVAGATVSLSGSGFSLAGLSGASAAVSYCGAPAQTATVTSDSRMLAPGPASYCDGAVAVTFTAPYDTASGAAGQVTLDAGRVDVAPVGAAPPGGSRPAGGILSAAGSGLATGTGPAPAPAGSPPVAGPPAGPASSREGGGHTRTGAGGAAGSAGGVRKTGGVPARWATGSPETGRQGSVFSPGGSSLGGTSSGTSALITPRLPVPLLPLPWLLLLAAAVLLVGMGAQSLVRRHAAPGRHHQGDTAAGRDAARGPGRVDTSLGWRMAGYVGAGLLVATYLLTATSVLMSLLTEWLPGTSSASLPGGRAYKVTAVLLSLFLTAIAVRYVYYYRCWLASRRYFARPRPVDRAMLAARRLPNLKFQVTTRGGALPIVERTVQGIVDIAAANSWLAGFMSVEVITESGEEADHLPRHFAASPVPVHALCLPAAYRTPNGTGLKARALHYMVERRLAGWNAREGKTFIVHLDEETLVTEEHLLVLVDYLSDDPRPVSQGPILYPLEWDKAPWMCRAMESLRPFGCSECARAMSKPPPPHLHGSNLVVEESVENEIGWDFGTIDGQPYIAEDLLFGLRAFSLLGRDGFGWHGATMLEQPPLSVYWAVQQRLRWVLGALQGWRAMGQRDDLRAIPTRDRRRLRLAVGFRVATYALGFPIGFAGLFFFLHPVIRQAAVASPLGLWRVVILLAGAGWVFSYQIGLARNLRYQELSWFEKARQHLTVLLLTPVSGLFETAGPFLALTRWLIGARQARWTPTPKTPEGAAAPVPVPAEVALVPVESLRIESLAPTIGGR